MAAYSSPEQATNDLHRLILVAVPPNKLGNKTIMHFCDLLGMSRSAVWKMIKNLKVQPQTARKIVEISEGRVTIDQLHRFVYGD